MRFILALLLFSLTASAGTVSRLYDFEPGTKAEADKVDAEFDNIISTINGNINSANILDGGIATADLGSSVVTTVKLDNGSVTRLKMATGALTYIKDYRKGCSLYPSQTYAVTQSVNVSTPCQIIVDGWVGELSATATVGTLDTGAFVGNKIYYLYGTVNGANGIDFLFSTSTPNTTTFRHPSSTTRRYIGSVLTNATASIAHFRQNGKRYMVFKDTLFAPYINLVTVVSSSNVQTQTVNVPPFSVAALGNLSVDTAGAFCSPEFYALDALGRILESVSPVMGEAGAGMLGSRSTLRESFRAPLIGKAVMYANVCTSPANALFLVNGWEEPAELY